MTDYRIRYVRYIDKQTAESYENRPVRFDAYGVYRVVQDKGTDTPRLEWVGDYGTWSEAEMAVTNQLAKEEKPIRESRPPTNEPF
jgi:hypothetical protein